MSATPKDTQPPVTQERLLEVIAKSNLSTLSNGCYGEICTQRTAYSIIESLKNNPPQLTGMEKTKLRALGAWDAVTGAADAAGKSYGVTGTPESRAAWAVETSEAAVKSITGFFSDPKGAAEKFGAKAASEDPKDIREVSASVSSLLLAAATAKAASSVTKGPKVKPPPDAPPPPPDPKPKSKSDGAYSLKKIIKLKTTPLKDRYKGENIPNNKDNWLEGKSTVKYLTDAEKEAAKLTIKDGQLFDSKGNLFDTSNATTWDGKKSAIFVMDEQGNMYASKFQKVGTYHHSTLGQGLPVSMAGEIKVTNGLIVDISNQSGHYMPAPSLMNDAMGALRDQGINLTNTNIRVLGK